MFIQKAVKTRRLYIPSKLSLSIKKMIIRRKNDDSGYTSYIKQI